MRKTKQRMDRGIYNTPCHLQHIYPKTRKLQNDISHKNQRSKCVDDKYTSAVGSSKGRVMRVVYGILVFLLHVLQPVWRHHIGSLFLTSRHGTHMLHLVILNKKIRCKISCGLPYGRLYWVTSVSSAKSRVNSCLAFFRFPLT